MSTDTAELSEEQAAEITRLLLLVGKDTAEILALLPGVTSAQVWSICGETGHDYQAHDAGDGPWYQHFGWWCVYCQMPAPDYEPDI